MVVVFCVAVVVGDSSDGGFDGDNGVSDVLEVVMFLLVVFLVFLRCFFLFSSEVFHFFVVTAVVM